MTITKEIVNQVFSYNEGLISRRKSAGRSRAGSTPRTYTRCGYISVMVAGKSYLVHRLIFLMKKGFLPDFLDHIDGDRLNNRIENLRECTKGQNSQNSKINRNNKSGIKGVHWDLWSEKWKVCLYSNGRNINVGRFAHIQDAKKAVEIARVKHHGEFANHG